MSLSVSLGDADNLLYLFSSASPDRPTYKRGVLDVLCYPKGHQLEFSYRKNYLQPPLFDQRASLKGARGAIVFVDSKRFLSPAPEHRFIPIRFVNIMEVSPKEEAKAYRDATRIYVRVELQDLISFDSRWDSEIKALKGRPIPPSDTVVGGRDYFYVIKGKDLFPRTCDFSQRDVWDQLVEVAATATTLKNCVFLSTEHPRPYLEPSPYLPLLGAKRKAYHLKPNSIYLMDLRVFEPRTSAGFPQIEVKSSSDLIAVSSPFATAIGGPADHSVLIVCKRTIESSVATLVVDVLAKVVTDSSGQNVGQATAPIDVIAAKPQYLLSIEPSNVVKWSFVILIFAGFSLTSTSKEFWGDWVCWPERFAVASKVVGAICLAWAAFLAFRKLPSGGTG
jgi:hypothetical protein